MFLYFEAVFHILNKRAESDHKMFLLAVLLEIIIFAWTFIYSKQLHKRNDFLLQDHYCVIAFVMSFMDAFYFLELLFEDGVSQEYKTAFFIIEIATFVILFLISGKKIVLTFARFFSYRIVAIILIPFTKVCTAVFHLILRNEASSTITTGVFLYILFYYWQSKTQRTIMTQRNIKVLQKGYLFFLFLCGLISASLHSLGNALDMMILNYTGYTFLGIFIIMMFVSLTKDVKKLRLLALPIILIRFISYLCVIFADILGVGFIHGIISGEQAAEDMLNDGISTLMFIFLGVVAFSIIYFWFTLPQQEKAMFYRIYFNHQSAKSLVNYHKTNDSDFLRDSMSYHEMADAMSENSEE